MGGEIFLHQIVAKTRSFRSVYHTSHLSAPSALQGPKTSKICSNSLPYYIVGTSRQYWLQGRWLTREGAKMPVWAHLAHFGPIFGLCLHKNSHFPHSDNFKSAKNELSGASLVGVGFISKSPRASGPIFWLCLHKSTHVSHICENFHVSKMAPLNSP